MAAVRRWFLVLILCPVLASTVAAAISFTLPRVYEAQVSLLIRPEQPLTADPNTAALTSDQITATYATLMTEPPLLEQVSGELGLGLSAADLAREIQVAPQSGTTIINVTVDDRNAVRAAQIGNQLVKDFIASAKQIQQQESRNPNAQTADNFVVVSPAVPDDVPVAPRRTQNVALGFGAGLLLGIVLVLLLERLDNSVKDYQAVQERTGLVPLTEIPYAKRPFRGSELVSPEAHAPAAEAYRRLRTNVVYSNLDEGVKSLLVTSAQAQEGKSRTAANLAVVLATAGHRTLLLDADFRRPVQHRIFNLNGAQGLADLVRPGAEPVDLPQPIPNLWVVPAGPTPDNPSELLGSPAMAKLIERFREQFQFVVIDTPPVNSVTDAAVLSSAVDGSVLIVEHARTSYGALNHARESLEMVGGKVLGVVLNKVRARNAYPRYYSTYRPTTHSKTESAASAE